MEREISDPELVKDVEHTLGEHEGTAEGVEPSRA